MCDIGSINPRNKISLEALTLLQIQITFFFPEIVHNNYMGIYKMNHRITYCINSDMVEFNRGSWMVVKLKQVVNKYV